MTDALPLPEQSPLFHAQHAARYERQRLIGEYEQSYDCRLVVIIDAIFPYSTTYLEELIFDADPSRNLHMMLASPGGDGETAIRLVRSAQSRCSELTVVVPDVAKSAARYPIGYRPGSERPHPHAHEMVRISTGSDVPRSITVRASDVGNRDPAAVVRLETISAPSASAAILAARLDALL